MSPTVNQMIADLIAREGGYVNHPNDKGGPTNYGITVPAYADYFGQPPHSYGPLQIQRITPELATNIYLRLYYIRPGINFLPELVRPILLDMAVNHGPGTAIKILQQALINNNYRIGKADGIIGSRTIIAATTAVIDLGDVFINCLVDLRLGLYKKILAADRSQRVFQDGWFARAESFRVKEAA